MSPGRLRPGPLQIRDEAARRLMKVLRLKPGDEFAVFGGEGHEYLATVATMTSKSVNAAVGELLRQSSANPLVVEVWCSVVRPNRFDWAVEKCTEAGADIIRPLTSSRSARGREASNARAERWERIAIEASEQCGRLYIPVLEPPSPFEDRLSQHRGALMVGDAEGRSWDDARQLLPTRGTIAVAIGPEGGFSDEERERASQAGAVPVRFGPNTLRTETAAVVATALLEQPSIRRAACSLGRTYHAVVNSFFGLAGAAALFLGAFGLHIVGGATNQGWLFAIAVVLIFLVAAGFSWIAASLARTPIPDADAGFLVPAFALALVLTEATLWAASDRAFELWHIPATPVLVFGVTAVLIYVEAVLRGSRTSNE